jgi:GT2 family glycosyltransferase
VTDISLVIPTLGRPAQLQRVLDHLDRQTADADRFEVVVVADAKEERLDDVDAAAAGHRYRTRRLQAQRPGASAARNVGWRAAESRLVLFTDDDVFAEPQFVAEHLSWHEHYPAEEVGVLGRLRWADELEVTPFMRWVERGIHFDFARIEGIEAGWGRFYTANASVKRALVERVGGFEEDALPFLYEDLDLAIRMHEEAGFRLLYNREAVAEHLHPMSLETWKTRVRRIAVSERTFVRRHPDVPPYFFDLFTRAAEQSRARGRGARLVHVVPREVPWLGPRAWSSAEAFWLQTLAEPFLEAWYAAGDGADQELTLRTGEGSNPSGSSPGGPK